METVYQGSTLGGPWGQLPDRQGVTKEGEARKGEGSQKRKDGTEKKGLREEKKTGKDRSKDDPSPSDQFLVRGPYCHRTTSDLRVRTTPDGW